MDFKRILRAPLFWVVAVIAITLMVFSLSDAGGYTRIDTSAAEQLITQKKVEKVTITNNEVVDIDLKSGQTYSDGKNIKGATKVRTEYVEAAGPGFIKLLADNPPSGGFNQDNKGTNPFVALLGSLLPIIILLGLFWFLMTQMQGGGSRVMQFGKSKAKLASKDTPKVTFADVAG
ncbi:cell division protein FtsH, partial [Salmonella enterica subsp. enterica serovar Senftenberg]|nr:cell division protein FtsH [Salmonella enterica subsp. enterica serovar Senftenberg]